MAVQQGTSTTEGGTLVSSADWNRIAASAEFRELLAAKARFIVPATIFFIVYYFALPALVGWAPKFMSQPVLGVVNLAYLFALSQFLVAWLIAFLYVRAANRFDRMGKDILLKLDSDQRRDGR
jgi:uncharacterized membrane protein (DUF485 family)